MPSAKNIKYTISRPEFVAGTAETRKYVLPVTDIGGLDKNVERGEDPAVIGSNMLAGEYPLAFNIGGPIPLSPRPCGGFAAILKSLLGTEAIPVRIGGVMRIRYTGASASCKLVAASDRTHGYQECGLSGKTLTTATGLSATTTYYFKVTIDGGSQVEYNITTGTRLSYDAVIRLMNEAMNKAGAYFSLVGGDLRCTSQSVSTTSVIALAAGTTGTDLFGALTGFTVFDAAVDGVAGTAITLKSYVGAKGSEALDSNFGTGGSYDLTVAANDTVAELVALIAADTGYEAEKLFGADAQDTQNIIVFTSKQGKDLWAYILFVGNTSTGYAHVLTCDLTDAERPTYSIQKDGFQDNFLYDGCVADKLSLSGALKGFTDGSVDLFGFTEATGEGASDLTLEDVDPLRFQGGGFGWGGKDYNFLRNISVSVANNHLADSYGISSLYRAYQQKGTFALEGEFNIQLDADTYAERAKTFDGTVVGMSFHFKGKDIETNIPEIMLVEIPYCVLSVFGFVKNGNVVDAHMGYKAIKPKGTLYNDPVQVTLVTTDSIPY